MTQEFSQTPESRNITPHHGTVSRCDRREVLGQHGCVIWLTGLSGSGKSTVAHALEQRLIKAGRAAYVLDGDNIRAGLCADLGFSPDDRRENIRRIGHVAALLADAGIITITAFISPYRDDRLQVRKLAGRGRFIEVFLDTPLDECQKRDPKGLYAKARAGQLDNLTGIDAPYEPPQSAEITLDTLGENVDDCVTAIEAYLEEKELIPRLRKK